MVRSRISAILVLLALPVASGAKDIPAGGETTQDAVNRHAFSLPAANMPPDRVQDFFLGNRLFNTRWSAAPGIPAALDGLGPTYIRDSCSGCHVRDGRGRPPTDRTGDPTSDPTSDGGTILLRISIPGPEPSGAPLPHPVYGDQIQNRAIEGVPSEGRIAVTWAPVQGHYGDGTPYILTKPTYRLKDPAFGPLDSSVLISPRVAPSVFGLGLLAAVPDETLSANADPDDADGDGISGRLNIVIDRATGAERLGRFGWKANQPSLEQQNATALHGDLGLTTSLYPQENCPAAQSACRAADSGGTPEVPRAFLDKLTFYMETLAVPARRNRANPTVRRGERLFMTIGCASCHRPTLSSGPHPNPVIANQRFAPYTDLLLHDMGEELADGRPDFQASGREWRTPPLWGLGLISTVNKHYRLLHDGRADGPAEAILWHGGEAANSRERFRNLPAEDRSALLAFLNSL
tara:strand:- start:4 stop:1392 length:1389 start_codon:yes stop_codon:yes gene_type:complete